MRTPSLRRRVLVASLTVVLLVLVVNAAFLFTTLDHQLDRVVAGTLETRLDVVRSFAADSGDSEELGERLADIGLPAVVRDPEGRVVGDAPLEDVGEEEPLPLAVGFILPPRVTAELALTDGGSVTVYATLAGANAVMRELTLLLLIGTALGALVAGFALHRSTAIALAPLAQVATAALRARDGRLDERLRPHDPQTEVGRLAAAFDEMLDVLAAVMTELEAAEEASRRFLADAAHQLRTPIAAMRSSVEAMLLTEDPARQDEMLAHLLRETHRSSQLLHSLLRVARLDRGRPPDREATDMVALCEHELERTQTLAPHLDMRMEAPGPVPTLVVEEEAIREAVANVLDNARRHAESAVTLRLERDGDAVEIQVRNDGPGVADEAKELIFERFATLDGHGGSGLGLPIVRGIARAHGGEASYEGGTFVIRLPLEIPEPPTPPGDDPAVGWRSPM